MSKKCLWSSILVNSALALALAVYTIVAIAIGLGKPSAKNVAEVALAVRVDDVFEFESGELTFDNMNGQIEETEEAGKYLAVKPGEFSATVVKNNKSKIVYAVTVYDYGTGTADDPYNITKTSDLFNLKKIEDGEDVQTINNNLSATYALRADIDLAGRNWIPVGKRLLSFEQQRDASEEIPYFMGQFLGNGYAIKNLTINVTEDNINDYLAVSYQNADTTPSVQNMYLDLGFFGAVRSEGSKVENVTFENAKISVSIENILTNGTISNVAGMDGDVAVSANNFHVNAAAVAANLARTEIENIKVVDSSIVAGGLSSASSAGFVGGTVLSVVVKNVEVANSSITANAKLEIGGVLGIMARESTNGPLSERNFNSTLEGVVIDGLTIVGHAGTGSRVAGVTALIIGGTIKNVDAQNLSIKIDKGTGELGTNVAGLTVQAYSVPAGTDENDQVTLQNIKVNGTIDGGKYNKTAGLVILTNEGTRVVDSSFGGTLHGFNVAGLVWENRGEISYTEEFAGKAVDAELSCTIAAAGLVYLNSGSVVGATEKTDINVVLVGNNFHAERENNTVADVVKTLTQKANLDDAIAEIGLAGIAYTSNGTISNFNVVAIAKDGTNAAGAVVRLGGELSNIKVDADIATIADRGIATSCNVAGAVAVANTGATISNVEVRGNIGANSNKISSGYLVAGLVAKVYGNSISIENATVDMNIRINYSNSVTKEVDGQKYFAAYVAGAIAYVEQTAVGAGQTAIEIKNISVVSGEARTIVNAYSNAPEVYAIDATQGAFGLVAAIYNANAIKVVVSDIKLSGYEISSPNYASAFGMVDGAAISNVSVVANKIAGTDVAGMAISVGGSTFENCSVSVETLAYENTDEEHYVAGFVDFFRGNNSVENVYVFVGNTLANKTAAEGDSTQRLAAGFAWQVVDSNVTYSKVVLLATVTDSKANDGTQLAWVIRKTGGASSTITASNVYALKNDNNTVEQAGVTYLSEEELTDVNSFAGLTFWTEDAESGYYWVIEDGASAPILKYIEKVEVEQPAEEQEEPVDANEQPNE